jgi:hypothetical protein
MRFHRLAVAHRGIAFFAVAFQQQVILVDMRSYSYAIGMSASAIRTTIYLSGPAAEVLDRVKAEYLGRYGIGATVSAVLARLLLGESVDEVIGRPYRTDLARIASERDKLRVGLRRARARRRATDLRRIHLEIAELFPRVKQMAHTLGRARRRNEAYSPDFTEAVHLEETLNDLMSECADAIVPRRRR